MTDAMKYILNFHAKKETYVKYMLLITFDLLIDYWNQVTISFPLFRHVLFDKNIFISTNNTHTYHHWSLLSYLYLYDIKQAGTSRYSLFQFWA